MATEKDPAVHEPLIHEPITTHKSSSHDHYVHLDEEGVELEVKKKIQEVKHDGERYFFDLAFFRRFIAVYKNISTHSSIGFTILLLCIILVQTYVVSLTGDVIGGFYGAIVSKDKNAFISTLEKAAAVIIASAILDSTVKFVVDVLAWKWRKQLCTYMQDRYFQNQLYYKLAAFAQRIDNPDQRITTDIDNFTITLASITQSSISFPLNIGFYGVVTYTTIAWYAPVIITGYFIVGYVVTKFFMSRVVNLIFIQERLEGDFRFSHVRIRTFAEAIALLKGDKKEHDIVKGRLSSLLDNKMRIVKWHWSINASSNMFSYSASILNYVIVALAVFSTSTASDSTFVAKASFNCIMLASGFSQIINVATLLADLAGFTARIAHLTEAYNELTTPSSLPSSHQPSASTQSPQSFDYLSLPEPSKENVTYDDSPRLRTARTSFGGVFVFDKIIKFENVTCFTPNKKVLAENISFEIPRGQNMLIVGPSGVGKSSLLRILTGLWPSFTGTITKPFPFCWEIVHVPQTPYLTRDTLAAQIVYPLTNTLDSGDLLALLKLVKLDYLLEVEQRLRNADVSGRDIESSNVADWCDILSPGEQQRINLARVFYHRPTYVLLDEATSSLSEDMESEIYNLLAIYGITVISVGHRSTLHKFHSQVLSINDSKGWKLSNISQPNNKS